MPSVASSIATVHTAADPNVSILGASNSPKDEISSVIDASLVYFFRLFGEYSFVCV